ncbi:MAG: IS110 family transposase [Lentisphaeria bacterium]|nr:IS110 family transposase [Lentisphaeria bacterium]
MDEKKDIWCGIDVSKNDMAVALDIDRDKPVRRLPHATFKRTIDGLREMLDWCAEQGAGGDKLHVLMESTGVYSRDLLQWFQNHFPEIHVSMGNPKHVKHFIDSEHLGNKTDNLDAMAIARMGTVQKPRRTPLPPPEYLQLQELIRARDDLKTKMRALEVSRSTMRDDGSVASASVLQVIRVMADGVKKIEEAIYDLVARIPEIKAVVKRMSTMPGIGTISACTILSELGMFSPEFTRTSFSGFTGLQPVLRQSGTSVNSSRIGKNGSPLLRKVIYLCSIHAVEKIPSLKSFHARLIARGKKPLTARCACMRKMLLILRSMVLNKTDFKENYLTSPKMDKVV